jgi:uncharacterized membrane protein YoaK (UPF0700 family)
MISRLPRWVWFGGFMLSFIAGMVNSVGYLGLVHQGITHMTGLTTLSAVAVSEQDWGSGWHLWAVMLSFLLGAAISGFIVQQSTLKIGRRYGVVLLIEAALLFASVPLLSAQMGVGAYFAAAACGLQNAMASSYSGAVIRTTHVSGLFTDLGMFLGHWLRGLAVDRARITLYLILLGGFFLGGIFGALLFQRYSYATLYLPATLIGLAAVIYTGYTFYFFQAKPPLQP